MSVTIREARQGDVDAIVDVIEAVAAEGRWIATELPIDRDSRTADFRERLGQPTAYGTFVAELDRSIVGSIDLHLAGYGVADLGMAVLDGHRGQGIGTGLLDRGVGWARAAGAHKVSLQVWPHNDAAIALYRRIGFVEEGLLRRHYRRQDGSCWDAVVMGLLLEDADRGDRDGGGPAG